jgi:hypothetical protein
MKLDLWDNLMLFGLVSIAVGSFCISLPLACATIGTICLATGIYGATR